MPWLPAYDQGKTPADYTSAAGMGVRAGHAPTVPRNQLADAIAHIAPELAQYFKQKRQDEIANALMNQEQPPRAESVDPSLQGAPATQPFNGGAAGLQVHQMYQKYLNDQQDRQNANTPDTAMDDLNYQAKYRQVHPEEFQPQANSAMTAYQQQLLRLREMDIKRKADRYGHNGTTDAPHDLYPVPQDYPDTQGSDTPAGGATPNPEQTAPKVMGQPSGATTTDKTPIQVKSVEEANALPSGTLFLTPDGRLKRKP